MAGEPVSDDKLTTMRLHRSTLRALATQQQELGTSTLEETLQTILFRHASYEAIARLEADSKGLADYQQESLALAAVHPEVSA
jgi:hypothetical protein